MQRLLLLLFLVFALPAGVFWWANGMPDPAAGAQEFIDQVVALRGTPPPRETPPPDEEEPEPEPEPEPQPEPEPEPQPPPVDPVEQGKRLYREGRFEEAVRTLAGRDETQRAHAQLGAAFAAAYPERVPPGDYMIAKTKTGDTFEGFAVDSGGLLKLVQPGGHSSTFPREALASRKTLSLEDALDHIARRVVEEGTASGVAGKRLFALIQTACAAGRPDAAAPLLPRVLEVDEEEAFFLSAVKNRVPSERQDDLYRAFLACELPRLAAAESEPVVTVRQPTRLGNNTGGGLGNGGGRKPRRNGPKIENAEVRELMKEAGPLRVEAQRLYKKVVVAGLDNTDLATVSKAIRLYDEAIALYEKAVEIEESDIVYAILRSCSRYRFQLGFWKQQLEGR